MNCNILLMGLTGVGKSSLINYLAGEELAEAGITSGTGGLTRGIHPYDIDINGQQCTVYDTEGLESSSEHSQFWQDLMDRELLNVSSDKPIGQWYHIVVYCIGANGGRVQDIELQMMQKLLDDGYGVIVAFTKADLASDEELQDLEDAVNEHFNYNTDIQFIPVCSKKTRNSVLEGKEELSEAIIESWGRSIINRLPHAVFDFVFDSLSSWYDSVCKWISEQNIGFLGRSKQSVVEEMNDKINKKMQSLSQKIKNRQETCFNDVKSVYEMLNLVVDTKTLVATNPEFNNKVQKLESSFVFSYSDGINLSKNLFVASAALFSLALFPVFTIPVAVIGSLLSFGDGARKNAELIEAFDSQLKKIVRLFLEQRDVFGYSLGAMQGYLNSYVELGICYLKGIGVKADIEKTIDYFNKVLEFMNEEGEYENVRYEWYMASLLYDAERFSESDDWIQRAAAHGSSYAKRVLKGESFESIEQEIDEENEATWRNFWKETLGEDA